MKLTAPATVDAYELANAAANDLDDEDQIDFVVFLAVDMDSYGYRVAKGAVARLTEILVDELGEDWANE